MGIVLLWGLVTLVMRGEMYSNGMARVTLNALLLLVMLAVLAAPAGAEQQATDKTAGEIFNTVMSPFCPGLLLANCPSSQAADLRERIRARLAAGATKAEVLDELYAEFGDEVLGAPVARGLGLVAWVVPGAIILLGAGGIVVWLRRSSRRARPAGPAAVALDDASQARLDIELSRL
jgi:cytochrome c-type biogenesis protein CcmH